MNKSQRTRFLIKSAICLVVLAALIAGNVFAAGFHPILVTHFGKIGETGSNLQSSYASMDECIQYFTTELNQSLVEEGAVLLRNENGTLPLDKETEKISVFGMSSTLWMTLEKIKTSKDAVFANALEDYGFTVNKTLRAFYNKSSHTNWGIGDNKGDGSSAGSWAIDEVPQSEYTDEVKNSYTQFHDAAIVVLSRSSGEGADLPRNMDRFGGGSEGYLELSRDERDMLQAVQDAGFSKIIVILHSANPMQMDFLNEYKVDAVVWAPGTGDGTGGIQALCRLLAGDANFSGKTVDTYCYDNLSAPAMQNFGDYRFVDPAGELTEFSYVNYAEGIYVGYKYYETRYEDTVMKTPNTGDFHYGSTVTWPFGFGLSYTSFAWSGFSGSYDRDRDEFTFSVTVKNTGEREGKEVVELYAQSPYTDYDRQYGVEKSAVQLVGFAKTGALVPGKEEKVTITVSGDQLRAYDARGARTYILDAGQYYFTAAPDAHAAVNNILAAKGYSQADGMDAAGEPSMVWDGFQVAALDTALYAQGANGTAITNQFDDAVLADAVYLSRSNWQVMDRGGLTYTTGSLSGVSNTTNAAGDVGIAAATAENLEALRATGWESSGNPNPKDAYPAITTGAAGTVKLADMAGLDYDDPQWDALLDQLDVGTMSSIYQSSAYGTAEIAALNKPTAYCYDGPEGIHNPLGPAEIVIAATWSTQLSRTYGEINGELALLDNYTGWYAPGMNLHRTPYSGRNYEYFSEDPFFAGEMAVAMAQGAQSRGLNAVPKHMALNNQETNRDANGGVATYCPEQAIRETYLLPFEKIMTEGGALGVMSAMNRIGSLHCRSHYALNIAVARGEWGYQGFFITDYNVIPPSESEACLAGGCNLQLTAPANPLTETDSAGVRYLLRESMHRALYFCANSRLVAGMSGESYSAGIPVYILLLAAADIVVLAYMVCGLLLTRYNYALANRGELPAQTRKRQRILNIVYYALLAAFVIAVLVLFFAWGLPLLQQAFKIS